MTDQTARRRRQANPFPPRLLFPFDVPFMPFPQDMHSGAGADRGRGTLPQTTIRRLTLDGYAVTEEETVEEAEADDGTRTRSVVRQTTITENRRLDR